MEESISFKDEEQAVRVEPSTELSKSTKDTHLEDTEASPIQHTSATSSTDIETKHESEAQILDEDCDVCPSTKFLMSPCREQFIADYECFSVKAGKDFDAYMANCLDTARTFYFCRIEHPEHFPPEDDAEETDPPTGISNDNIEVNSTSETL